LRGGCGSCGERGGRKRGREKPAQAILNQGRGRKGLPPLPEIGQGAGRYRQGKKKKGKDSDRISAKGKKEKGGRGGGAASEWPFFPWEPVGCGKAGKKKKEEETHNLPFLRKRDIADGASEEKRRKEALPLRLASSKQWLNV